MTKFCIFLLATSIPLLTHGLMYLHLADILTVFNGAVLSITSFILSLNRLKFSLQVLLFNSPIQSTLCKLFLISANFSSFSDFLLNSNGDLSRIFVCFSKHNSGRWSDMSDINKAESKDRWNFSLMKILSISVAVCCVM